ncbi:hypothetical protein [Pontiella sp.]|uniref:hypothetical protein n=1 Tax=Pontiella sp. TaxID=2837462 RepID=UPI0035620E6F
MKKQWIFATALLMAAPVFSATNELPSAEGGQRMERRNGYDGRRGDREGRNKGERRELTEEEREEMKERRLQMLEKTLKDIGVTEEQQQEIVALQAEMKEQMRAMYLLVEEKKKALNRLEDVGAPQDQIFAAIDEVTAAQAEQMKILARNRIQMERILGKEKFEMFMDKARNTWKEHGRRGGQNIPPAPRSEGDKDRKPASE